MTRPGSLVAAALAVVLAAGVVSSAGARVGCVVPGAGTLIRGRDLRRRGGMSYVHGGRMPMSVAAATVRA